MRDRVPLFRVHRGEMTRDDERDEEWRRPTMGDGWDVWGE
jgi:hypothetical protein